MPQKFVMVRHPNGSVGPMPEQAAKNAGYEILEGRNPYRRDGRLVATKPRVAKGGAASATEADAARVSPDKKARSGSAPKEK